MSRHYSLNKAGYKDYAIDEDGNIYSGKKYYKGLRLSPRNRNGYLAVTLRKDGKAKSFNIHRLMAIVFLPHNENLADLHVNHIDGNKKNNKLGNLEWSSPKENAQHREKLGLQKRISGQNAYNAKLADKEIVVIKKLYFKHEWEQKDIAALFECSQGYVSEIVNNKKRAKAIQEIINNTEKEW